MIRSKKVDKIYYDLFLKNEKFKTPYFIVQNFDDSFYVFKDINSNKMVFDAIKKAEDYIYSRELNPIIIIIKKTIRNNI